MEKIKQAPLKFKDISKIREFVLECEHDFESRLDRTADELLDTQGLRIIALSGPTCSGKTTAAKKIISELSERGRRVHVISIDDFYYDKDVLHKMMLENGNDEIDYDSPRTIDLPALESFTDRIFDGRELLCPVFDFHSGRRISSRSICASSDDIFVFEGIQALYPEVTAMLDAHGFCSAYIAPMSAVAAGQTIFFPNELRFLRRLVRDANFRSTSAEFTFKIWGSVRKNEEENIFPFADNVNFKIDSSFAYELGVLKPYLLGVLGEVDTNGIYRREADEILLKVAEIEEIPSMLLPENSLYREFV